MSKFCTKCGADLSKTGGFCPNCKDAVKFSNNGVINNRSLKEAAKEVLKGNMWNIWKPMLIILGVCFVYGLLMGIFVPENSYFGPIIELLFSFSIAPMAIGYILYLLKLVRKEEFSLNDLFEYYDKRILVIIGFTLLVGLFTFLWSLLFIIPGVIAAFGYVMVSYVFADGTTNNALDTLKESKRLMKGYKMDYFGFSLSFLGWVLLTGITFGVAGIFTIPYMAISSVMYYDELKKIKAIN